MSRNLDGNVAIQFKNIGMKLPTTEGYLEIISNLSGEILSGEIHTLIGPSGSGKSTLLSFCNLLLTPSHGEVWIEGKEIRQWEISELRRYVGMVFQTATMLPGTVFDNLNVGMKLYGKNLEAPHKYLERVGLPKEFLHRNAQDLSGGQKQRVALARTLVVKPSILLLDEVTSALDPTAAREIEELITNLNRQEGLTIVWVTHQLEQALRVGDTTWLIVSGRMVEQGRSSELLQYPKSEIGKQFISGHLKGEGAQ